MALLALYLHGSAVTGDQVAGSDVDLFAIVEPDDDPDTVGAEVLRSSALDRWRGQPVELAVLRSDELDPLWTNVALTAQLISGERPAIDPPTPEAWVRAAWAQAGACLFLDGNPVKAALLAAAGRAVAAGAPIPTTGRSTWPDLYRDTIGGEWCEILDRIRDERRHPTAEVRDLARQFLDLAGDIEYRDRTIQLLGTVADRTVEENVALDPRSERYEIIRGALTPDECDRAIALDAPVDFGIMAGQPRAHFATADITASCDNAEGLWLTERMVAAMSVANDCWWRYDLLEALPATVKRYGPGTRHPWHIDVAPGQSAVKLFAVALLNDPGDFTGGRLQVRHSVEPETILLNRGDVFVAPAWLMHRVTRVKTGQRWSCVVRAIGKPWR